MHKITQTNVTVMVTNMDKAISFYVDVLGFSLLKRYGNHYAQISAPGIIIGLHPSGKKSNPSGNISIGFTVDNFTDAKNRLIEKGILFEERQEEGGNFIHFKDPDGTFLYFIDPKK